MTKRSGLFVELYTDEIPYYIDFFEKVLGFEVFRNEGKFVELRRGLDTILLNGEGKILPKGHPFYRKLGNLKGLGVEIGVSSNDLEKSHTAAKTLCGLKVTKIVSQEWELRDFRVILPDGYYIRITEPT